MPIDELNPLHDEAELQHAAIAAEIHDQLLPHLFATRMRLEVLLAQLTSESPSAGDELHSQSDLQAWRSAATEQLSVSIESIRHAMDVGRDLIGQLYPPDENLAWEDQLLDTLERVHADHECELQTEGTIPNSILRSPVGLVARRIAQEAIRNAVRHGGAGHIRVTVMHDHESATFKSQQTTTKTTPGDIAASNRPQWILLTIEDDGVGFQSTSKPSGFGLRIMSMRARSVGGDCEIRSTVGGPTRVQARLPVVAPTHG